MVDVVVKASWEHYLYLAVDGFGSEEFSRLINDEAASGAFQEFIALRHYLCIKLFKFAMGVLAL